MKTAPTGAVMRSAKMGSKNNPGKFDCLSRAEPDEPIFVLLGRDPVASIVVAFWARIRAALRETEPEAIDEACDCADAMNRWAQKLGKGAKIEAAAKATSELFFEGTPEQLFERVRKLEGLCKRAADAIQSAVVNDRAVEGLTFVELKKIEKELRSV